MSQCHPNCVSMILQPQYKWHPVEAQNCQFVVPGLHMMSIIKSPTHTTSWFHIIYMTRSQSKLGAGQTQKVIIDGGLHRGGVGEKRQFCGQFSPTLIIQHVMGSLICLSRGKHLKLFRLITRCICLVTDMFACHINIVQPNIT